MSKKKWIGRVYLGRDENGKQLIHWVGRFDTKRERDEAVVLERRRLREGAEAATTLPTCEAYVERYLAEYDRTQKESSASTRRYELERFRKDFAGRSLDVPRVEAKDWALSVPAGSIRAVVALYNHAIDEDDLPLGRNPFRGLVPKTKGRSELAPPTKEEFDRLLDACSVHGEYGRELRAMFLFAAFTLMRPSEVFALEWADIDFTTNRIAKNRRVYKGRMDTPKYGKKIVGLTAPAKQAIAGLPRTGRLVFHTKRGKRMAQTTLGAYWSDVQQEAGLSFDFYHATKHYGVWFLWTQMGLSDRAIAAQAGWKTSSVTKMLEVYGHAEVGALEEIDRAFEDNVVRLRAVGE